MSLAYLSNYFPSLTETFIQREVIELRRRGVEVATYSLRRPDRFHVSGDCPALEAKTFYLLPISPRSLVICHLRALLRHPLRYWVTVVKMLYGTHLSPRDRFRSLMHFGEGVALARRMEADGISHIHAHFASQSASVARVVHLLAGIPYSFTGHAHDVWHDRLLMPEKLKEAAFVVACSAMGRRALAAQAEGESAAKIHLVYHGLDVDNFPCQTDGDGREKNLILSVGRLTAQKGFPDLVEALAILTGRGVTFRCVILGEGEERGKLEGLIRARGLESSVLLPGPVSHERVREYYRQAWLFVLPCVDTPEGNRDGIPNVLMEAMASGLPVVTTTNSGQPEIIDNGIHGLLVHSNAPRELAQAIEALCSDTQLRGKIQAEARRRIVEDFDNRKTIEPLVHLFIRAVPGLHSTTGQRKA